MKELLKDLLTLLYSIVSREDELVGHEDIVETAEELIPKLEEEYRRAAPPPVHGAGAERTV